MTHFNEKGKVGMREKLGKLQESREERDLLHCLPPPLVVFSLQTFSKFISFAIFFWKKESTRSENPVHDHTSNKRS